MRRWVVDTNVAIVANGRADPDQGRQPSICCRRAAVEFLERLLRDGRVLLDLGGEIQGEYGRHLQPAGQPGVGDRFYQEILKSAPERVDRVSLPKNPDGSFHDFPDTSELATFDRSDRKFAALGRRERAPIANATDSDWLCFRAELKAHKIEVCFVCGCDPSGWFVPASDASPARPRRRRPRGK